MNHATKDRDQHDPATVRPWGAVWGLRSWVCDGCAITAQRCQVCVDNDYRNTDGHTTKDHLNSGPERG